jgi:hypothetical protein
MKGYKDYLFLFFLCLSFLLITNGLAYCRGQKNVKIEAIEKGVAKWVITTNTAGEATVEFEWILPAEKKEK